MRTRIAGFLDEFYIDGDPRSRHARLVEEPISVRDPRTNALIGAIGEHLCNRWGLAAPPRWTEGRSRFLSMPWYIGDEETRFIHFKESPQAFRRRFIFTEAEPLRRARMPKDGRWWHFEALRTGMGPIDGEVVASVAPVTRSTTRA